MLVLSRGPIRMRRTEGRDNFGVTPIGECDVVVVGDSLDLEAKSDTDENEFWDYFASMTAESNEEPI